MNRRLVFKSDKDVKSSMVRYYILWACQLMASYLLVYIFTRLLVLGSVAVAFTKIIVDLCLFVNAKRKNSSKLNIKLSITNDANELNIYLTTVGENEYLNFFFLRLQYQ